MSGSTTLNQSRTQNTSNEILTLSGTSVLPGYNAVGNMITTTVPGNWSSGYSLIWDAWNRLVQVMSGGTVVATYGYDGMNRRITQVTAAQSNDYYYSKDWQIVQENSVSSGSGAFSGGSLSGSSSSSSNASITQYVWGQRGVDDVVLRDVTTNFTQRLYALRDVMHVTAITSSTGVVLESYDYDAYGNTRVNGSSSNVSFYNWNVRYCSYLFDSESGFYQVRNRYLHPGLGRWLSRDPLSDAELSQGNNLYWYVGNNPVNRNDPLGLDACIIGAEIGTFVGPEGTIVGGLIGLLIDLTVTLAVAKIGIDTIQDLTLRKKCRAIQDVIDQLKDDKMLSGCKKTDCCCTLSAKKDVWVALAQARSKLNNVCFNGGNIGHQEALEGAWINVANCDTYIAKKCK